MSLEKYYIPADGEIIAGCIDGRCGCGNCHPNSAGASLSLYVAARLLGSEIEINDFFKRLQTKNIPLSAHIDEHNASDPEKTGCGFNDRLDEILEKLAKPESRQKIFEQIKEIDPKFDRSILDEIGAVALSMVLEETPRERLAAIENTGGTIEKLINNHEERKVKINMVPGTTLDRGKSDGKYFNVDAWAFEPSARAVLNAIGTCGETMITKFISTLTALNVATRDVLNAEAEIEIRH